MLVYEDHNELNQFTLSNDTLFGVKQFNRTVDDSVVFLGVPFGLGNGYDQGTGKFPQYYRGVLKSRNFKLRNEITNPLALNLKSSALPIDNLYDAGNIYFNSAETQEQRYDKITKLITELGSNIPFTIGGDHSITFPVARALNKRYRDFAVVHLDAHTDIYTSDFDQLYKSNRIHHHGNFVSHCLELEGLSGYYQYGIRGLSTIFQDLSNDKLKVSWTSDVKKRDISFNVKEEKIYLTIDIDAFDPSIAPATATPVANGLNMNDFDYILDHIGFNKERVIGIDIVEINPQKDQEKRTLDLCTELIVKLLNRLS